MPAKKKRPRIAISSSQSALRVPRKKLSKLIEFVAEREGVALAAVDLAVVGPSEIAKMNRTYLRHPGPTDVLSFDLSEAGTPLISAQIVVCAELALRQARWRPHGPQRELMLYVVHGLLHLMGYEDQSVRGAVRMHAREEELLDEFDKAKGR